MIDSRFEMTPDSGAALVEDFSQSPTPYHAVRRASELLAESGFMECEEASPLPTEPGGYFIARGGTLIAWQQAPTWRGFSIVGAHTDSPNLRVRRNPGLESAGIGQIGMEVYGGVLLNSWLDRDLGLAGRVEIKDGAGGISELLICERKALMRIPQLAIHLDRGIRTKGLKLNAQTHLIPMWTTSPGDGPDFRAYVADLADCSVEQLLSWDLMAFDIQPPTLAGRDAELFVSARIDNLYSSFAAVRALCALASNDQALADEAALPVLALFDHEEVGSTSSTGADGAFLITALERIALANGRNRSDFLNEMAASFVLSVDGAHATHPNYVAKHDNEHPIRLNGGIVVKRNANQRYATDARGEARIVQVCEAGDIPVQYYIHRNDIPCGSTIGPATAAKLGATTVDVGAPQLAMHSIRETAGIQDFGHLGRLIALNWQRPIAEK